MQHVDALPAIVTTFWQKVLSGPVVFENDDLLVTQSQDYGSNFKVIILKQVNDLVRVVLPREIVGSIERNSQSQLTEEVLRHELTARGIEFHPPDFVFYAPDHPTPQSPLNGIIVRQLVSTDLVAFEVFQKEATEEDLDAAWVEFDHVAVFGCFLEGKLIGAASVYPWQNSQLLDIGVLTLPEHRGKGAAKALVQLATAFAHENNAALQYRCQSDNLPSIALARAAGLILFGEWEPGFLQEADGGSNAS